MEWFHGVLVEVGLERDVQLAGSSIRVIKRCKAFHSQPRADPSIVQKQGKKGKGKRKQGVVRLAKQRKSEETCPPPSHSFFPFI